jgi:hypothetical protein
MASSRTRLFLIVWLAGFIGVLSFQFVDFAALIAKVPQAQGKPLPIPMAMIRLLSVVQPGVLVGIAAFVGAVLAPKLGLSAPACQALAEKRPFFAALRPQILPGVIGGAIAAPSMIGCWLLWKPLLAPSFTQKVTEFSHMLPPATRLLYGGITEEVLLRWGFMTFLVWLVWKLFQKEKGIPRPGYVVAAIFLSAVVFGAGHLPIATSLNGSPNLALISYVIVANSIFGIIAGFLYWKKGLESAIIAHMLTHVGFLLSGLI